jgi:LmbE family N-acetylglucosaminyl deacetylase
MILFVFAHPDDESYGPAGTIAKLAKQEDVIVVSLCNGARPGAKFVAGERRKAFEESCKMLGAKHILYSAKDCTLEYESTLKIIEDLIKKHKPRIVYTHNISDIHKDHRVVAECCMIACRPKVDSSVLSLYMCEMTSSSEWSFGQLPDHFIPTTYVDVTEFMDLKRSVLSLYKTEIYEYPDARSVKSMEVLSMNRGRIVGLNNAEAFKLVYEKIC